MTQLFGTQVLPQRIASIPPDKRWVCSASRDTRCRAISILLAGSGTGLRLGVPDFPTASTDLRIFFPTVWPLPHFHRNWRARTARRLPATGNERRSLPLVHIARISDSHQCHCFHELADHAASFVRDYPGGSGTMINGDAFR